MYETRHRHTFGDTERVSLSFLTSGIKISKEEEGKKLKREREKRGVSNGSVSDVG